MFKEWLISDIEKAAAKSNRVVISDPHKFLYFIVKELTEYAIVTLNSPDDEMLARQSAQTSFRESKVVFLCFFQAKDIRHLMEFSGIGGFINMDNPDAYIRQKLFESLGLNTTIKESKLLLSAKLSSGKNLNWWKGIANETIEPLDFKEHLHDLIRSPKQYQTNHDEDVYAVLRDEVFKVIDRTMTPVDAPTLVNEFASAILSGLISNRIKPELLGLYYWWTNSSDITPQLKEYASRYHIPTNATITTAHFDHPFEVLDKKLLSDISFRLRQNATLSDLAEALRNRVQSNLAPDFKPKWLKDLLTLLTFDSSELYLYDTISKITDYYRKDFSRLDKAMRHLYSQWLSEPSLLRPLQELYESHLSALLAVWFANVPPEYIPSQLGLISKAMSGTGKIAVFVCDGLRLEIAESICDILKPQMKIDRNTEYAKLPSVTENGMSALFGIDTVVNNASARINHLQSLISNVKVTNFSELSDSEEAEKLVVMFGDIDTAGEHKGMAALRDINNYEAELSDAIKRLQTMGYEKVYLTADHGFVITGILDEASKVKASSGVEVKERFFLSDEYIADAAYIRREDDFPGSQYQYYSKTDKPFRTRGEYGYAHGGFTPQECLIPYYCFISPSGSSVAKVEISNKSELSAVTGQYFNVRLKGNEASKNKKIKVMIYNNGVSEGFSIATIDDDGNASAEFEISSESISVVVVDAQTGSQYDSAIVSKLQSRDLDDLF